MLSTRTTPLSLILERVAEARGGVERILPQYGTTGILSFALPRSAVSSIPSRRSAALTRIGWTERLGMEIRAEAVNLFNTPQFGTPNNTVGEATTGAITLVINPQREIQLALRVAF